MTEMSFEDRILKQDEALGKLTAQALDGDEAKFVETAAHLLGSVVAGSPVGGVLAKKAVQTALARSSWGRTNQAVAELKAEQAAAQSQEALSKAIAGHLTTQFAEVLRVAARQDSIERIKSIVDLKGDQMERKLDAFFMRLFEANLRLHDDHVEIRRDLDEMKSKLGVLTAHFTGRQGPTDGLRTDDQGLQDLCRRWVAVLVKEYASEVCLVELGQENGWFDNGVPTDIEMGGHHVVAEVLVEIAQNRGAEGVMILADAVMADFPGSSDVVALHQETRALVMPGETKPETGREGQVRECIQYLMKNDCLGVALMEPFGFDARDVVGRVVTRLSDEDEKFLPVRLVPRRNTTSEERLYKALFKDLHRGLEQALGRRLYGNWLDILENGAGTPTEDSFEDTLYDLARGPVEDEDRVLLIIIEGLGRISDEQRQSWGYALARSNDLDQDSTRRMKILAWGGLPLYELRTVPSESGFSAFHQLEALALSPLSKLDIQELLRGKGECEENALVPLSDVTGGHPALVRACVCRNCPPLDGMGREELLQRLKQSEHMTRLSNALNRDASAKRRLGELAGGRTEIRLDHHAEQALKWLGIIVEADTPGHWTWTAPVMAMLAEPGS